MIFIGFSGYAQSGKDTLANAVIEHFEDTDYMRVRKVPLAYKLKQYCEKGFGITAEGSAGKDKPRRAAYQFFGQLGRDVYKDIWIDLMQLRAYEIADEENIDSKDLIVVIPDVRHHNELDFLMEATNAMCFAIDADERMVDVIYSDMYKHESEIHIPELRKRIKNKNPKMVLMNNTKEDLEESTKLCIKTIGKWLSI